MSDLQKVLSATTPITLAGAPAGFLPWLAADLARAAKGRAVFIAPDEAAMRALADAAHYFAPELETLVFPAWDCLPYDRASPSLRSTSERLATLHALQRKRDRPQLLVTTVNVAKVKIAIDADLGALHSNDSLLTAGVTLEVLDAVLLGGLLDSVLKPFLTSVTNLIRNAMEAMQDTSRRELVVTTQARSAEDQVAVTVADSGTGLAPEIADHLFQPFMTTKKHGMGVGLSICRTIVESHGGKISASSEPGQGTTFMFTLRAVHPEELENAG